MGITQVISPFYELLPRETFRKSSLVGQLCWVPVPRLEYIPWILDIERQSPTEHYITKFTTRQMKATDFRSKNRLPLKTLDLRDTEEFTIQRTKRRLAIIVAADYTVFDDVTRLLRQRGRKHLQQESITVAPLYGVETSYHPGGFPQVMVARIKALLYRQFFFCPEHPAPLVYESIVRLDRLQQVMPRAPAYEPCQAALSREALSVLMWVLQSLFGASEHPDLQALKQIVYDTVPPEARPS